MSEENLNTEEVNENIETPEESIQIADDVVAIIAGKAVSEVSRSCWNGRRICRWNYRSFKWKEKPS